MAGVSQKLSKGQEEDVIRILRNKLLAWTLIGFTLLAGLTGLSLWGVAQRARTQMEVLVGKQFEEPRIQEVVREVAAERATTLMNEQIQPEVVKFKEITDAQLKEIQAAVAKTRVLEEQSQAHEKSIQSVITALQVILAQSEDANKRLNATRSEIVTMQKAVSKIQYYLILGHNRFPNPFNKQMEAAINELLATAIPDPVERSKFIAELQASAGQGAPH